MRLPVRQYIAKQCAREPVGEVDAARRRSWALEPSLTQNKQELPFLQVESSLKANRNPVWAKVAFADKAGIFDNEEINPKTCVILV